jgi:hypothetical protein
MATELTLKLPNRTGQLASVAGALGEAGVNIRSLAATTGRGQGTVHILVDDKDAARARRALRDKKFRIAGDRKVVEVRLADKPGTLARVAARLGKARVNIDSAYMSAQGKRSTSLAIGVKDARAASKALGRR